MNVSEWIFMMQILLSGIVFAGLLYFGGRVSPKRLILHTYEVICMKARNEKRSWWDYDKWEDFLLANGAGYHYGKWMNPVAYISTCIVVGGCCFSIGTWYSVWIGSITGILGVFLPGILLEYLNKRDNENMLTELDLVYSALSIQIRAGVYVSDALSECYGSVHHVRLREAMQDLCSELVMKSDLENALEQLQRKFNNKYIDTLCITIIQACESGQAVELLGDIAEQIKDMELLMQQKKKEQLDRSTTFYQLGIFTICLGLTLYLCVTNMFSASLFFE